MSQGQPREPKRLSTQNQLAQANRVLKKLQNELWED